MGRHPKHNDDGANLGMLAKGVLLFGAMLAASVPTVLIAFWLGGRATAFAGVVAGVVCLVSGWNGLAVVALLNSGGHLGKSQSGEASLSGVLAGMLVRMVMPLTLCIVLAVKSHALMDAGFAYFVIGFYQVMLLAEVALIAPGALRWRMNRLPAIEGSPANQ